jgi:raffinose/stachyose/melibiose transport system permease protein
LSKLSRALSYVILIAFSAVVILPLLALLGSALSPKQSGEIELSELTWSNFFIAWTESNFERHLFISIVVSLVVVMLTLVIGPLAAYGLAIIRPPGSRAIFILILAGLMIPLESILIPLYYTIRSLPIGNSPAALMVAHVGLNVSFGVFWMRAAFLSIPPSLIEAAVIDGAKMFQIFRLIVIPLAKPALITLALLTFLWTWNDYFLAFLLISDPTQLPVTVALGEFSTKYSNKYNLMSATAVLVALPIIAVYIIFQRRFIEGVLSGALKG